MLTVIGSSRTRTFRVLWALEEMGLAYSHVPALPRSPEIMAVNPSGKVPALVTDEGAITDSVAILLWLADRHGRLAYPAGSHDRACQDAAMCAILDEMESALWMAAKHSFILPEHLRQPAIKDSLKWEFEAAQIRFASRLGDGPFIMGDMFTIADIVAGHCGAWARRAGFPETDAGWAAYLERLWARPAYQRVDAA